MKRFIVLIRIVISISIYPTVLCQNILTEPEATLGELIIKVLNPPSEYFLNASINLVGMGFSGSVSQQKIYSLEYNNTGTSQSITGGDHIINGNPGTWAIEHVEDGHPDGGELWIGYGLYEIRVGEELLYLDYLDSEYPYALNPDIYIEYDFNRPGGKRIAVTHTSPNFKRYTENGEVIQVWRIFGKGSNPVATNFYVQSTVPISANQIEEKLFTNVIVNQNAIIPSGKLFTINRNEYPRPTILGNVGMRFNGSGSMTINGTLNAVGTSANYITFDRSGTSGSWGGIVFNSGSSGSIEYCDISHATTGITSNYMLPMVRYNTITNNVYGISVSNIGTVSNEISYNTIQNNTSRGISLYYASPKIYSNVISDNAYYGISTYQSSPYLYGNTITGHSSNGLNFSYYSSAKLVPWNAYGYYWGRGNNKIKNNTGDGIIASYWSNLYLGSSPYGGYKNICNNTGYELRAYYGCTVTAQLNWWGAYPPNVNEFYPYQSTIDYTDAIPSDPNPDQSMVRGPNGISNSSMINSAKSDLDKAYGLQSEGKFDEAIAVYDSYITANPPIQNPLMRW